MPPSRKKPTASSSAASGPKPFSFKNIKRSDNGSGERGGGHGERKSRTTTTRVHKCLYQSGEQKGEETGNRIFVFNPRYGSNDKAKDKVREHAYGKDDVSGFNKDLNGFVIKVHVPKQAMRMHNALRELDSEMPEDLDLDGWEEPEITAVKLTNLNLPDAQGVTATMLEGYTYPLYKKMRSHGYDFIRSVHGKEGVNRWVRVHETNEDTEKMQTELQAMLEEEGWRMDRAVGNAEDWGDDE